MQQRIIWPKISKNSGLELGEKKPKDCWVRGWRWGKCRREADGGTIETPGHHPTL